MLAWQVIFILPAALWAFFHQLLILKTNAMAKTKVKKQNTKSKRIKSTKATLERIRLKAAGVDIGSSEIFIAILDMPVISFETFTCGIVLAIKYLKDHQITTVAMEATGIYWLPIYEMFDQAGIEVYVVNGGHVKNVPGRKTDVLDSEWLRELHTFGLVRSSFIPDEEIRKLRYFMRLRKDHITMGASHIQHIQKNMDTMNIKLHNVISNIMGVSGLKIIRAILAGERSAIKLMELCNEVIKGKKREEVIKSLEGNYKPECIFGMQQALEMWEMYQNKIQECDKEIGELLEKMTQDKPTPAELSKPKQINSHKPDIADLHLLMMKLTGENDATRIAGINDYSLLQLISEIGLDLTRWPTSNHFVSWLDLAPPMHQSGKSKRQRRIKRPNNAGQIFRELAKNVGNGKHNALVGFFRRLKSRSGAKVATKATARKIAVYYYNLMTKGIKFVAEGIAQYEERYKEQMLKSLTKRAKDMGLKLVPIAA